MASCARWIYFFTYSRTRQITKRRNKTGENEDQIENLEHIKDTGNASKDNH